jgi:excisionase family DNA binding protein
MKEASGGDGFLTTSQVAILLHVHPNTVRKWVNKGLLSAYRLGPRGDRRFTRDAIEAFLQPEPSRHTSAAENHGTAGR